MPDIKQRVALTSIAASAGLTLAKGAIGLATGSLAILSEAAHSLLDLAATVMTYFAVRISGKPADEEEATAMLQLLSGHTHEVMTAVAIRLQDVVHTRLSLSEVAIAPLSDAQIRAYVATGEPMDKAGAYAIQGRAGAFVRRLSGSYTGVMGLPLFETAELLKAVGLQTS